MTAQLSITLNGEPRRADAGSIADLVRSLELDPGNVAVERNGLIVPRSTLGEVALGDGAVLEIVHSSVEARAKPATIAGPSQAALSARA